MAGKKILVADDSISIQKVIRLALANESYEITCASTGEETLTQLREGVPDFILIDVALPGHSAYEIREFTLEDPRFAKVAFVLMSSNIHPVDEDRVRRLGFSGRLVKPFIPAQLRQVLEEAKKQKVEAEWTKTSTTEPDLEFEPAPPVPPPFYPSRNSLNTESDELKKLTTETIQISENISEPWSVNETVAREEPPSILDDDSFLGPTSDGAGVTFPIESSARDTKRVERTLVRESPPKNTEEDVRTEVRRILPEIAERVVREEIRRLLSE